MDLNSREIATLVWIGIALVASVLYAPARPALLNVWRAFTQPKVTVVLALLGLYVVGLVCALATIDLWESDQLKNTLVWSVAVGFGSMFRVTRIANEPDFFRKWIADNLKIIVAVEFLVNFYTFPFVVELLMLPFLTFVLMMQTVNDGTEKHARVAALMNGVLVVVGIIIAGYAIYMVVTDFGNFAQATTLRDFYTPILLSLLFVPFIFVMHMVVSYENASLVLRFSIKDEKLRRYAMMRALLAFGPSVTLLKRWTRNIGGDRPKDKEDIRRSIREVKDARRRERQPETVSSERGWSPNIARTFLQEEGLVPGDYHRSFEEWYASSPCLEIGPGAFQDNLAYHVEGDELVATRLKLILNVNNPENPEASEEQFLMLASLLLRKAIAGADMVFDGQDSETVQEGKRISLRREDWQGGIRGGYDKKLTIEVIER